MITEFVVVGLGVFGRSVAGNLARSGHSVLAIDSDPREVEAMAQELDAVVQGDATDEAVLRELRLDRIPCAVVAIGADSMESSILATALLRQLGVPRIVARALNSLHERVLLAVGAHEVVNPEAEVGERLARRLVHPNVLERIELGESAELCEVELPESFVGKTPVQLDLRREHEIVVVAVERDGRIEATVRPDEAFATGDVLLVVGQPAAIERLAALA